MAESVANVLEYVRSRRIEPASHSTDPFRLSDRAECRVKGTFANIVSKFEFDSWDVPAIRGLHFVSSACLRERPIGFDARNGAGDNGCGPEIGQSRNLRCRDTEYWQCCFAGRWRYF